MTQYKIGGHVYEVETRTNDDGDLRQSITVDGQPEKLSFGISGERLDQMLEDGLNLADIVGLATEMALSRIEWIESQD